MLLQPNAADSSYGSIAAPQPANTACSLDPTSTRSLLDWLLFTRAARVNAELQHRNLELETLLPPEAANATAACAARLSFQLDARNRPLWMALLLSYANSLALCGVGQLVMAAYAVFAPVVLHQVVLGFSVESAEQLDRAALGGWCLAFFGFRTLNVFVTTQVSFATNQIWLRLTAAIRSVVFSKAMRKCAHLQRSEGAEDAAAHKAVDINNLVNSDATDVVMATLKVHSLWLLPLQIAVVTFLLYSVLDVAAFAGVAVIAVSLFGNYLLSKKMATSYREWMRVKDQRMRTVREMFGAIQIVKFNAWEGRYADKLLGERARELRTLASYSYAGAASTFVLWSSPLLVSTISFAIYALVLQKTLTAAKVFTAMALFNALRGPLRDLPATIQVVVQAQVSAARLRAYLELPEFDESCVVRGSDNGAANTPAVCVVDGTFSWSDPSASALSQFLLRNIDVRLAKGEFAVVYGSVGAGKSSLCSALLGEMNKMCGQVFVNGRVAYYSQQPWIQNMSIKDNILFGEELDAERYAAVLDACCLFEDLGQFPAGDETEIGEKGVNLSGGQKARVALARACYARGDIYILDSPLSAVDTVVQKAIFSKCLCGLLADRTVVLVTHNPAIIASPFVTRRIGLSNGRLVENVRVPNPEVRRSVARSATSKALVIGRTAVRGDGTLIQAEERQHGRVASAVWRRYLTAIGGVRTVLLLLASQLLWQFFQIASDFWLSHWTRSIRGERADAPTSAAASLPFIETYAWLAAAAAVMVLVQGVILTVMGLRASKYLFEAMTDGLLHAPLRFFDANPIGRILNRYGGDIAVVDKSLPKAVATCLSSLFAAVCALGAAAGSVRWYFGVSFFVPVALAYVHVAQGYTRALSNILRLVKILMSPIFSHIVQSEQGVVVLRAFGREYVHRAIRVNHRLQDVDNDLWNTEIVLLAWYAIQLQFLGCGILAAVVGSFFLFSDALTTSPAIVGLAFSYALSVDAALMTLTKAWSDVQNDMVSGERVLEYNALEREGDGGAFVQAEPHALWPQKGEIVFERVTFSYKPGGAIVLKDVSFAIKAHEKVGIVGRTGAGKSSLTMALFRMNELAGGRILVDGVDIATVPLATLRSRMSIIPQSPVLLEGSLRTFLDPFGDFTDGEILQTLRHVELLRVLQARAAVPGVVAHPSAPTTAGVAEVLALELRADGESWSVGERQLLCMARALLRRSTVVIMDEATAAMDHATEAQLSAMVARELRGVTLLTIAHRLATVQAADRILVLRDGRVAEFGSAEQLLNEKPGGVFAELVRDAKHSRGTDGHEVVEL